jgi:hypothetical protein
MYELTMFLNNLYGKYAYIIIILLFQSIIYLHFIFSIYFIEN